MPSAALLCGWHGPLSGPSWSLPPNQSSLTGRARAHNPNNSMRCRVLQPSRFDTARTTLSCVVSVCSCAAVCGPPYVVRTLLCPVACCLQLCHGVLGPVLSLIQSSGDASELSSAVSLLLKFLRTCPTQQLLVCAARSPAAAASSSSAAEEAGLAALVVTARQLLASSQQDDAVRLAGPLMAQLLKVLPQQMCSPLPAAAAAASSNGSAQASGSCVGVLLYDTVVRMASAETCSPRTVAHLLEFVVRLVLLPAVGAQGVVELLAAMSVPRQGAFRVKGDSQSAFVCVGGCWRGVDSPVSVRSA